jgi:hypothetical protein
VLLSETFLILITAQRYIAINIKKSLCKVLFLSDFNKTLFFFIYFRKKFPVSDFMQIRPVGAELFHMDGQTDKTKLIVVFGKFTNAPGSI